MNFSFHTFAEKKNKMGLFSGLFGSSGKVEDMLSQGAVVIDVRSPGEFRSGHVEGSKNIPLQELGSRVEEVKKLGKPVVLCCASGMRSGQATSMLKKHGLECVNGGGWTSVNRVMSKS